METGHLKEYVEFANTLNYAKAAGALFVSEPTLRSHIKMIEDEAGVPLTTRRDNQLELSSTGMLFLKYAREISDLSDTALEACRSLFKNSASLLIGTLGYAVLEEILTSARENIRIQNPEIKIDLRFTSATHANLAAIIEHKVDLTLYPRIREVEETAYPDDLGFPPEITALRLGTEPSQFWMTKDNPLFAQPVLSASDLKGQSLLLGNTDNMISAGRKFVGYFKKEGVDIKVDHQPFSSYLDYMFSVPNNGFGMIVEALHPTFSTRKDFRIFTVSEFSVPCDMHLIYNRSAFDQIGLLYLEELAIFTNKKASGLRS